MTTRESRVQELRAAEEVHEMSFDNWESPALLDTKNIPSKPGYVQRWVRTKIQAADDQNNVFRKINQGWKPRTVDSVPKGQFIPNVDFNGLNVIGIHGMILMERPQELHDKHAAYNRQQANSQMVAAEEQLWRVHQSGDGMSRPKMTSKTNVSKGRIVDSDD